VPTAHCRYLGDNMGTLLALGTRMLTIGAAGAAVLAAAPAQAASPLRITSLFCESGESQYTCSAGATGGTGSVSYAWSPGDEGPCSAGQGVYVTVTVTDSTGATASLGKGLACRTGPWR
jgi:hypothetical protein